MDLSASPHIVRHAVMKQDWHYVTFLHWAYEAEAVQRLLPDGLTVQTFDGKAWVGLVPFRLDLLVPAFGSRLPFTKLPETNVRTYVVNASGRRGVWFFSLDADHLIPVVIARQSYKLPYFWSKSRVVVDGEDRAFSTFRKWPGPKAASARVSITLGEAFTPEQLGEFDHFLTARYTLFSRTKNGLRYANIFHAPWTLRHATVNQLDQNLVEAAGLPTPTGDPIVHYGEHAAVRIGVPHRV